MTTEDCDLLIKSNPTVHGATCIPALVTTSAQEFVSIPDKLKVPSLSSEQWKY